MNVNGEFALLYFFLVERKEDTDDEEMLHARQSRALCP